MRIFSYLSLSLTIMSQAALAEPGSRKVFSYVQTAKEMAQADAMDLENSASPTKTKPPRFSSPAVSGDLTREQIRHLWKDLPGGNAEVEIRYIANAEERALELSNLRQQRATLVGKMSGVNLQIGYKIMKEEHPEMITTKISAKSLAELQAELNDLRLQMTSLDTSIASLQDSAQVFEKFKRVRVTPTHSSAALEAFDQLEKEGRIGVRARVTSEMKVASKGKLLSRILPGTNLLILGASLSELFLSEKTVVPATSAVAADR